MAEAGEGPDKGHHSLQFISSEASSQSTNWLQRLEFPMQVPSRQRNSPTPQAVSGTAPTRYHQARFSPRGPELSKVRVGQRLGVLRPRRGVPLTVAEDLVRAVPAVVCPVAPQHVGHTAPIVALAESLLAAA